MKDHRLIQTKFSQTAFVDETVLGARESAENDLLREHVEFVSLQRTNQIPNRLLLRVASMDFNINLADAQVRVVQKIWNDREFGALDVDFQKIDSFVLQFGRDFWNGFFGIDSPREELHLLLRFEQFGELGIRIERE